MKKTIAIALVLVLIFSCKKDNSNGPYGSWKVNGVSYQATVFSDNLVLPPGIEVLNGSSINAASMELDFYNALPTSSGTFHVISQDSTLHLADEVQVYMVLSNASSSFYHATGSGSNQNITVTISGGKISATGSGINISNGVGTTVLGFDIHE